MHPRHALILLMFGGCARTVVKPHEAVATREARPSRIVVYDFAVTADQVTTAQGVSLSATLGHPKPSDVELGREAASALAEKLAGELREQGFVVVRRPRGSAIGPHDLAIDGEFLQVDEGDQAKRLVLGFGAGASRVDTAVHVYDGAHHVLVDFRTHADSGKMPGAAASLGVGAVATGAVTGTMLATNAATGTYKEYQSEVERMSARSADQAARYLSQFFGKQGWIADDKVKKAKID